MSKRLCLFRRMLMQASQGREASAPKHEARTQSIPRKEQIHTVALRVIRSDKWCMKEAKLLRLMARA
jgi:hypothetical protein